MPFLNTPSRRDRVLTLVPLAAAGIVLLGWACSYVVAASISTEMACMEGWAPVNRHWCMAASRGRFRVERASTFYRPEDGRKMKSQLNIRYASWNFDKPDNFTPLDHRIPGIEWEGGWYHWAPFRGQNYAI